MLPRLLNPDFEFVLKHRVFRLRCKWIRPGVNVSLRPAGLVTKAPIHDRLLHPGIKRTPWRGRLANRLQGSFTLLEPSLVLQKIAPLLQNLEPQRERPSEKI